MKKDRNITQTKQNVCSNSHTNLHRSHLSPVLLEMAKRELEEFKAQSDESFLIRDEMDKKLSSL